MSIIGIKKLVLVSQADCKVVGSLEMANARSKKISEEHSKANLLLLPKTSLSHQEAGSMAQILRQVPLSEQRS